MSIPKHSICNIPCSITIERCLKPLFGDIVERSISELDKNRDKKVVKRILAILCSSQQLSEHETDCLSDPESPKDVPQKMEMQKGDAQYFEMMRAELDKLVRTLSEEDKMDIFQGRWFVLVLKEETPCVSKPIQDDHIVWCVCRIICKRESCQIFKRDGGIIV